MSMFKNEPFLDFTIVENKTCMLQALKEVEMLRAQGALYACPIIGGKERKTGLQSIPSFDPSTSALSLGTVWLGSESDANDALHSMLEGKNAWENTTIESRSEIFLKAAEIMRRDKFRLNAIIIREVGKTWKEADADIAEAIDFCTYYAQQAAKMWPTQKTEVVPGEDNIYFYQPRGISCVISPWNFPFAIACGMTVASLITGNATILKPAEQSSIIAMELTKILYAAGVPSSAFAFIPGLGETVGRALTASRYIDCICFTGSRAVGLEILKAAATVQEGQRHIKKVILELGGKNAIIVDDDADPDEAIKGILYSAFGFAGQKCSACSRLIVVGSMYDSLMARLKGAAQDLIVGIASDPSSYMGPVIDEEAYKRILSVIEVAKKDSQILVQGKVPSGGFFIPPTIFKDVPTNTSLWKEEIFGPVIAATKADSFTKALELANDSDYALTGGLYSRSPLHIEQAKHDFKVGNLYINRGCTGALVCRQPFGGFKMSGIGSKAGGPDYLLQFVEPRTVSENTMRRGFAG